MNALRKITTLLAAGILATGCVVEVDFEPIGGSVAVDGAWTINGFTPDAALCSDAGIAEVELRIYESIGSDFYTDATLVGDCADGGFLTGPFLLADTYRLQWVAYDASGSIVATSTFASVTANAGDTIVADVNFDVDVIPPANTFAASWSINGTAADSTLCTEAGIATVRLNFFDDAGGTSLAQSFDFDCGVGVFDSRDGGQPTMPEGMFFNQWQALDGSGAVVGETLAPFPEADTTAVDHINLAGPDFEVSLTPTLRVNFQYELADALGSYGTCTEAGVVDSNYLFFLFDGGGTMVSLDPAITTCQNFVEFPDITPDTYAVEVSGESFDGAIKWGTGVPTSCGGLIAESGLEEYDCFVDIVP